MQSGLGNYCSMAVADRARVFVCVCVRALERMCVFVLLCLYFCVLKVSQLVAGL